MKSKTSSWKRKIDPAFDKFIKLYLEFLEKSMLPGNEGYLVLDDRNLKILETDGFPSLASMYEHDKPEDALRDFAILSGEANIETDLKRIKREIKKKNGIVQTITEVAKMMGKDSRDYYLHAFEHFRTEDVFNQHISNLDDVGKKELYRKCKSDSRSLSFHCVTVLSEKERKIIVQKLKSRVRFEKFRLSTRMIKRNLFCIWNTISLIVNKKSLRELLIKARRGDDDSLFALIKVDKTLFDHDWVRLRIRKAMYSGDTDFFYSLAKAIKSDPLQTRKYKLLVFVVMIFFWKYGLYSLTVPELMQLLQDSGISIQEDEVTFRKYYDRIQPFVKY